MECADSTDTDAWALNRGEGIVIVESSTLEDKWSLHQGNPSSPDAQHRQVMKEELDQAKGMEVYTRARFQHFTDMLKGKFFTIGG